MNTDGTGSSASGGHPALDTSVAHQARIYNYWLGGKDNYAADRAAGQAVIQMYPDAANAARANRAFLARVVRYLATDAGIRQFLDIGTGIPTASNTHEVAQALAPESRVVYVDNDPVVLAHARALLTSSPEGATDYLDADLRDPHKIIEQAAATLDLSQPVAVTLLAILHVIGNGDDPYLIVDTLMNAVPPGSYLALSHVASDTEPPEKVAAIQHRLNQLMHQQITPRSHAEVSRFFHGLELVEPGVVLVQDWRPANGVGTATAAALWGGVGLKR